MNKRNCHNAKYLTAETGRSRVSAVIFLDILNFAHGSYSKDRPAASVN